MAENNNRTKKIRRNRSSYHTPWFFKEGVDISKLPWIRVVNGNFVINGKGKQDERKVYFSAGSKCVVCGNNVGAGFRRFCSEQCKHCKTILNKRKYRDINRKKINERRNKKTNN